MAEVVHAWTLTDFDLRTAGNNNPLMSPAAESPALTIYGRPVLVSSQLSIAETQGTASKPRVPLAVSARHRGELCTLAADECATR